MRGEKGCQALGKVGVTLRRGQTGWFYLEHPQSTMQVSAHTQTRHSPRLQLENRVCTHTQTRSHTQATHSYTQSHVLSHSFTLPSHTHARPHTHLELVADLMLLDGGCLLPLDAEVPGREDLGAERRPVVLAQEHLLWQPLHHPGGGRRPGLSLGSALIWGGKPQAALGAAFGLGLGGGGGDIGAVAPLLRSAAGDAEFRPWNLHWQGLPASLGVPRQGGVIGEDPLGRGGGRGSALTAVESHRSRGAGRPVGSGSRPGGCCILSCSQAPLGTCRKRERCC